MKKRKNNLYFLGNLLFTLLLLSSCRNSVTITRSYIYSTHWAGGEYQGFEIAKIKLLDSTISVFNDNFNRFKLAENIIDTSFCFYHFTGSGNYNSKSFFNRNNKNVKWRNCNNLYDEKEILGLLELNTWYIITGLHGTEDFYVYIDNEGGSHTYSLGPTNW